jgi:hypothetical protein
MAMSQGEKKPLVFPKKYLFAPERHLSFPRDTSSCQNLCPVAIKKL